MEYWNSVFDSNDVNESYSRFLHIFNKVSNNHAPLKLVKLKNKSFKPWVTAGLKKSMKTRDKIYKKWLASHDLVFLNKYKFYRNKITVINKIYRESFYNQVLSNSNDSKKMWDNINIIINKKRPNSHTEKLYADDKYYQQPQSIANILNSYFCNIPSSLASKLPKTNMKPGSYLPRKTSKFKFSRVSELEVFLSLENLNTKKCFGADKVHPLLVSIAIFQIYRPITHIINLSISQGIFPDSMKIAKVVPIFKQGSRSSCDNYRPVSILPTLSKIFEKCIFNQFMFYLVNEDILTPRQYAWFSPCQYYY